MRLRWILVAAFAVLAVAASSASAGGGPGDDNTGFGYGKDVRFGRALKFCDVYRTDARLRECLTKQLDAAAARFAGFRARGAEAGRVRGDGRRLPAAELPRAHARGRTPLRGRGARDRRRPARLPPAHEQRELLGRVRHGLLMYLAPQIGYAQPRGSRRRVRRRRRPVTSATAASTAFGHAYMRLYGEQLPFALHACRSSGGSARRLRRRRLPRLLDRGLRARQRKAPLRSSITSPREALREGSRRVRARLLVPRAARASAEASRSNGQPTCVPSVAGSLGLQHGSLRHGRGGRERGRPVQPRWISASRSRAPTSPDCVRGVRVPDLAEGPGSERLQLIRRCATWGTARSTPATAGSARR